MARKIVIAILSILFLLLSISQTTKAQEEGSVAQYVIQPGDTLSKIAVRFNISVEDLASANGITNPNQLFVGDILILPGVDWIEGVLDVSLVSVGETFRSLRRRYHLEGSLLREGKH